MQTYSIPNPELSHVLKSEDPGRSPAQEIDLSQTFGEILRRANGFVPAEAGTIFLRDDTGDGAPDLLVVAVYGEGAESLVGARLGFDQNVVGNVLRKGQVHVSSRASRDQIVVTRPKSARNGEAGSVVALPLTVGERTVGVLELVKERPGEVFDERELELLEVFAQSISAAIGNAVEAQRSRDLARRDDLTRLYNDRYLHHTLAALLATALTTKSDCGLIFFDLDLFKNINDTHGHLVGSRVLKEVGDLLRQVLPGSAIPARYGGDEFVVILPESSTQETFWVAETIRKTLETNIFLASPDPSDPTNYPGLALLGITCSLGLANLKHDILPHLDAPNADPLAVKNELLSHADSRMYRAKDQGRNCTVRA
jgi:diguanylate cyclase (GGDEF)-like protein